MIVTLVRIKENFRPWDAEGHKSPKGKVGYLVEGSKMSDVGEVALEAFGHQGEHLGTYYHVPATAIEMVTDRDWYEAFEKFYDRKPYIKIELESLIRDDSYGVWLHVAFSESWKRDGWLNYKHRLLGSEDLHDARELIEYWSSIAMRMGVLLVVDPYVQELCLDYEQGDKTFPNYHKMWAENMQRAMNARAIEQHRDDVP